MPHPTTKTLATLATLTVAATTAAAALALAMVLHPSGSHADVQSDSIASVEQYRDQLVSQPLAIDPTLVKNMLAGKLDQMFGVPLSDYQRNILKDGVITLTEYKNAETDWRSCMVAAGFSMPPLALNALGRYNVQFSFSGSGHDAAESALHNCSAKFTNEVEMAWDDATQALADRVAFVQEALMDDCLSSHGYSLSDVNQKMPNTPAYRAYATCASNVGDATGAGVLLSGS